MLRMLIAVLLMLLPVAAHAQAFDHAAWDGLLKRNVVAVRGGVASQVRYDGMARD